MRRRIIIGLALLLALCLIGDAIALLSLDRSIRRIEGLAESYRIQLLRTTLNSSALRMERDILAHLTQPAGSEEQLRDSVWRFKDSLRQCGSCHHTPSAQKRLEDVRDAFEDWLIQTESLRETRERGGVNTEEEAQLALASRVPAMITAMIDHAHARLTTRSNDVEATVHQAWVTLCVTLLAALLFGGVVALHLQRRLTKPVSELLEMIRRSRQGESVEEIVISGDQEFRELGEAFGQAYQDLKNAQEGILQAEKMAAIGRLAAGVAHEVANPLASISSVVQMMRRSCASEEDAKRLDLIMSHIGRISGVVRDTLSFSRPSTDDRRRRVEISVLLDQSLELTAYDERSQGIEVTRDYDPTLRPIQADPDALMAVFTNIILNAIDALCDRSRGDPVLEISARAEEESTVVMITDNGPGMSEQDLASAFEPFFTTKQPGHGTGLGLWVCYETMRKQGGSIRLDSREGHGTTVTVELPYAGDEATD